MKKLWIVCLVIMACISSNLMEVNAEEETIKEEVKEYKSQINFRSIPSTQPTLNGFTVRLYRNVLNREPDQNGFTYWTERLKQKKVTGIEILQQFFNSNELKKKNLNSTKFMELLYQTALNRKADASGLAYWVNQLKTNSRNRIVVLVGQSNEFVSLCKKYGIDSGKEKSIAQENANKINTPVTSTTPQNQLVTQFIERLYTNALGRKSDSKGIQGWYSSVISGKATGASLVKNFFGSNEFNNRHLSNEQTIRTIYATVLDRSADAAGLKSWKSVLEKGYSLDYVLKGFVESTEFSNLCKKYGITRGSIELTNPRDLHPALVTFLSRMYYQATGTNISTDLLESSLNDALNGKATLSSLALSWYNSPLSLRRGLSKRDLIQSIYTSLAGRKATETEILENSSKNTDGIIQAALHTESSKTVVSRYQVKSGLRVLGSDIVKEARKWVNYGQYAFGGVDPTPGRGADCSGFVQYVFKQNGIELPRGAYEQGLTNTIQITDVSQIRAGDLQVWSGHIGICTGQGTSIHALNPSMGIQELPMFSVYGSGAFLGFFRRVDIE